MKHALVLLVLLTAFCGAARAEENAAAEKAALMTAMDAQVAAWNRADIPAFMQEYEDSDDTTFVGAQVRKGYQLILKRYEENYTTREQMGTLSFHDVDVRLLPDACGKAEIALMTGKFHLERTAHGAAAKDDGIFSLVWRKGPQGWKIVLDHTS
ncbi:MAG TPA: nuclear transport factor 2 family protein [Terracidiphilus sp.]|nr:nuclear transport factor 2 family protein [Terracidiphilus sp.]